MKRVDKTILCGDEKLFPKNKWLSVRKLIGEQNVLTHPIFHDAFRLILKKHKRKHKSAFLFLCTSTRPYSISRKWKRYLLEFEAKTDLIVVSNGGFVPTKFWCSYPFLNYDAGPHENNVLYKRVMYERMMKFFKKHKYDYVVANFSHKQRNREPAVQSLTKLKDGGYIKDYILIPDKKTYEKAKLQGWKEEGMMYPDLHPVIFRKLKRYVNKFSG